MNNIITCDVESLIIITGTVLSATAVVNDHDNASYRLSGIPVVRF